MTNSDKTIQSATVESMDFQGENHQDLISTEQKYQFFLAGSNVGTWEWNIETGHTQFNERWAEIIGYTLKELEPTTIETWVEFAHPDDLEQSNQALQACFSGEAEFYNVQCRMRHKMGHWIWVQDRGKVFKWTDDGKPLLMYGSHSDITEQKQREEALRHSKQAFSNNFTYAGIGMAIVGTDGQWLEVNPKLIDIVGYPRDELERLTFQDITFPEDLEKDLVLFKEVIDGKRDSYQIDKRYIHKDGHLVYVILSVSVVRKEDGTVENFISQIIDISDFHQAQDQVTKLLEEVEVQNQVLRDTQAKLEAANASLLEQSVTDPLTNLGNRRVLNTSMDRELRRTSRAEDGELSLILLDVDLFKSYNDDFGHPEGDRALKLLADILSRESRAYDIVTRFGGEEFAILLPDTDSKTAATVAERLRTAVEEAEWPNRGITISLGVCSWLPGMTADEMIRFADIALYEAKKQGRNCSVSWRPSLEPQHSNITSAS